MIVICDIIVILLFIKIRPMTVEEIRDIAINSSQAYFDYLKKNDKGTEIVNVHKVNYINNKKNSFQIELHLSKKLFDTEAVFIQLLTNSKKYDSSHIKIVEYDSDKNILLIKPTPSVISDFQNLKATDIKIISDLTFLISRVKVWFEENGSNISIPNKPSILKSSFSKIEYLEKFQPSSNQKESLSNIFTNPFSYIWGAPGTGKTQFVLAYSIMHYIKNDKKVFIIAPTNNAIEQVLRGVIKMTDEAGIDRKKILRLGIPSKKFATVYPEVCEESGKLKHLQELEKQLTTYQVALKNIQYKQQLTEFLSKIKELDDTSKLIRWNKIANNQLSELNRDIKLIAKEVEGAKTEIDSLLFKKKKLEAKRDSFIYRTKRFFSGTFTIEESIENIEKDIENLRLKITNLNKDKQDKEQKSIQLKEEVTSYTNQLDQQKTNVLSLFSINSHLASHFTDIISDLNNSNLDSKKEQMIGIIESELEEMDLSTTIFRNHSSSHEILLKIKEYEAEIAKIEVGQEILRNVQVTACTLDGYIGRYTKERINADHIFLDEAGYANIIKALTLFKNGVPITFLGDHMQLPPVCEINDTDIKNDEALRDVFVWAQSAIHADSMFNHSKEEVLNAYLNGSDLKNKVLVTSQLDTTHRFGSSLSSILAQHVYDGNFKSANNNSQTKIYYIHAPKEERLKSRESIKECLAIKGIVQYFKQQNINEFSILSPYTKQVRLLGNHMPDERNNLKIMTVHKSQGQEWDVVILSVVDTNDKWFVDSQNKMSKGLNLVNTAVSRAKKMLVIVCDETHWLNQRGQLITDLIKNGEKIN